MTTDQTMPHGRWEFDNDVTEAFDDMLRRSIPDYEEMRSVVTDIVGRSLHDDDLIVDLGCSRGEALKLVLDRAPRNVRAVGVETSPPMLAAATERFAGHPHVQVLDHDLRNGLPTFPQPPGAVLSVLTLQFTPIDYRPRLLTEVRQTLRPGGVLVLVEKVLPTAGFHEVLTAHYHDRKRAQGYTDEQVAAKAVSLEGVLVPLTARWNEDALAAAGFREVECVWRSGLFAAWIAR